MFSGMKGTVCSGNRSVSSGMLTVMRLTINGFPKTIIEADHTASKWPWNASRKRALIDSGRKQLHA